MAVELPGVAVEASEVSGVDPEVAASAEVQSDAIVRGDEAADGEGVEARIAEHSCGKGC